MTPLSHISRRPIFWLLLILVIFLPVLGMAQGNTPSPTGDADITAAAGTAAAAAGKLLTLVKFLRGFGIVLLLIALTIAAIAATMGKTEMAIGVAVGGILLFGGFWIFALIRDPLDSTNTVALTNLTPVNNYPQHVAPILQTAMYGGLTILTSAIAPFVIIYGMFLALGFATGKSDASSISSYTLGAIIAFSASLIAQFYSVIPLDYTQTVPNSDVATAPAVTYGAQIVNTGPIGGGTITGRDASGGVITTDANGNTITPDPTFVPQYDANGNMQVRSTYYSSGETHSDPDTDAGRSSTGVPLQYGDANTVGVAAVDPNLIPYGSQITVQTADGPRYFIAADTGGAVKSQTASQGSAPVIDFYSKTQVGGAYSNVTVTPYSGNFMNLNASQKAAMFNTSNFQTPAPVSPPAQ